MRAGAEPGDDASDASTAGAPASPLTDVGQLLDDAPAGIMITNAAGHCLNANRRWCELSTSEPQVLAGSGWIAAIHVDDRAGVRAAWRQTIENGIERSFDFRFARRDGGIVWLTAATVAILDGRGERVGCMCTIADVTRLKESERRLIELADHDDLTNLFGRRRFYQELDRYLAACDRYGWRGAVLALDVDGLKAINDTLGHAAGDRVLQQLAQRLRRRLRPSDAIGRIGGDEFSVLLPEIEPDDAASLARELGADLGLRDADGRVTGSTGVSVGLASIDGPESAASLMQRADRALYASRSQDGQGAARGRSVPAELPKRLP